MKSNPVQEKSYRFALRVIGLYRALTAEREYVLSKQMLRAGTGIGANVEEALGAVSRRDFAAKMSVASKEARECRYWLRLLGESGLASRDLIDPLQRDCDELVRILASIVKTTQTSL